MELETERLLLRRPEPRDVDAYAEFWADPDVVRYIGGATKTWAETKAGVDRMIRHWNRHGIGLFSIERKADGRLVGRAGFLLWDTKRWVHSLADELDLPIETEIGWTLGRAFWGVGYATEASIAARDWALEELGLRRLISLIQRPNTASVRVAEKLGETLERANIGGPFSRTTDLYALGAQPAAAGIPAR